MSESKRDSRSLVLALTALCIVGLAASITAHAYSFGVLVPGYRNLTFADTYLSAACGAAGMVGIWLLILVPVLVMPKPNSFDHDLCRSMLWGITILSLFLVTFPIAIVVVKLLRDKEMGDE